MKKMTIISFILFIVVWMIMTLCMGYYTLGTGVIDCIRDAENHSFTENVDKLFSSIDSGFKSDFWMNDKYIDLYGGIQRMVGRKIVIGSGNTTVVESESGNLYFCNTSSKINVADEVSSETVNRIVGFSEYCNNHDIDFIYTIAPCKSAYLDEEVFPSVVGMSDYKNTPTLMTEALNTRGVNSLDLSTMLHNETDLYASHFFSTDHHWKIETAFWGFQKMCEYMNAHTSKQIPSMYYDSNQYSPEVLPSTMVGSMGARVGNFYHGADDYTLITPKYNTKFYTEWTDGYLDIKSITHQGTFQEAFLRGINKNSKSVIYGSYISSDRDKIHIDNKTNNDGQKILFIKDSFGIPVSSWLACVADELWVIDLRFKQNESMYDFVLNHDIDTVIVMYNSEAFGAVDTMYSFDTVSNGN